VLISRHQEDEQLCHKQQSGFAQLPACTKDMQQSCFSGSASCAALHAPIEASLAGTEHNQLFPHHCYAVIENLTTQQLNKVFSCPALPPPCAPSGHNGCLDCFAHVQSRNAFCPLCRAPFDPQQQLACNHELKDLINMANSMFMDDNVSFWRSNAVDAFISEQCIRSSDEFGLACCNLKQRKETVVSMAAFSWGWLIVSVCQARYASIIGESVLC
jgi:hypothetical protein